MNGPVIDNACAELDPPLLGELAVPVAPEVEDFAAGDADEPAGEVVDDFDEEELHPVTASNVTVAATINGNGRIVIRIPM